tara:strand:- start:121 stop:1233 length:1113 start_codon:yes stop_codon:yes gene_type:complete
MLRSIVYAVTLALLTVTSAVAGDDLSPLEKAIERDLIEGWTARPYGLRLNRFLSACEQGEQSGCNEAAWLMETSGYSTERAQAERLLKSRGSCPYERRAFSMCLYAGRMERMQRACTAGNASVCRKWGDTLQLLRPKDFAAALNAFAQACKLGDGAACRSGAVLAQHDPSLPGADETGLRQRGCELGEASECWMVAKWHAEGSHGYERDHGKYKELMVQVERLEQEQKKRWTRVRTEIQKDAFARLETARAAWRETRQQQGPDYCIQHATGRRAWVVGSVADGAVRDWEACRFNDGVTTCQPQGGPAPQTMEQLFDACSSILEASPVKFEFGFHARRDGALLSCYTHAEDCSNDCGEALSVSRAEPGRCP